MALGVVQVVDAVCWMSLRRVKQELRRVREHEAARKARENELVSTTRASKDEVRADVVERRLRRAFRRTIDEPLQRIEESLVSREKLLSEEILEEKCQAVTFEAFLENVAKDRYHFVGYAVNLGFRSINRTFDDFGTALHHAVRLGHCRTTEELLRHGADANSESPLGSFPELDVWVLYKRGLPRGAAAERETVSRCGKLLRLLARHGALLNHQDTRGYTCLMHAAALGITEIVLLLLGFKADPRILTADGKTAADLARDSGNVEVQRLLLSWPSIAAEIARSDFRTTWLRFLADPEAAVGGEQDVVSSLIDLEFQLSTLRLSRPDEVRVDDDLLRESQQLENELQRAALSVKKPVSRENRQLRVRGASKQTESRVESRSLNSRRQRAAETVARDGKFLEFTWRPATLSALMIPLRKPAAPLVGTAEDGDELRRICSQGPDHDVARQLASMEAQIKALPFGRKPQRIHSTNAIGAYDKGLKFKEPNEMQSLLNRLSEADAAPVVSINSQASEHVDSEPIANNKRFKFVETRLLPELQHLHTTSRAMVAAPTLPNYSYDSVTYAKGRLESAHNLRGPIEMPWAFVEHNYRTVSTDRTV